MKGELTKAQRDALNFILRNGPGAFPPLKSGRPPKAVDDLVQLGLLETLNSLRQSPQMYEITAKGRAALSRGDQS